MNQLIASNQPLTMRSFDFLNNIINPYRDAHGESKVRNNDFIKRIESECDDLLAYETFVSFGQTVKSYTLDQDQMMLVGMRESKAVRKSVLAKIKELANPQAPTWLSNISPQGLAIIEDMNRQIELSKPKVEFHDKIVNDAATFSIRDAAKKIQQRPNKFNEWLRMEGYLCKNNMPKQQYVNQGLFKTHTGQSKEEYQFSQTRVTSKGLAYFTNKLGDENL
ncbi:antirepressor protein [Vibrio phage 1.061.O._10N.286.55.C2]|nr:antirepressor protein [Vibrio phage 1.061.O._10N.286.55.C2]